MPHNLALHVAAVIDPHPDIGIPVASPAVVEAARAHRRALAKYVLPASPEVIGAWFWPIGDAVEWTPTEDEFTRRLAVLISVSNHIPWGAWNLETQRAAILTFRRLPSVAAVIDLVSKEVESLTQTYRALSSITRDT